MPSALLHHGSEADSAPASSAPSAGTRPAAPAHEEQSSPNDRLLVDFMILLLENGFSPNEWNNRRGDLPCSPPNLYPLDVVMANTAMDPTEKDRLIEAMRKHGALTYEEASHLPPSR